MNDSPNIEKAIAFQLTFADIGTQWESNSGTSNFFDRHLRYAESIPIALVGAAQKINSDRVEPGRRPEFPFMSFGLLDTVMFNCFARQEPIAKRYHAGMSVMLPLSTLELACYYFSYPALFPNVGDPERMPLVRLDAVEHPPMFQLIDGHISPKYLKGVDEVKAANIDSSIVNASRFANATRQERSNMNGIQYFRNFDSLLEFMLPKCPVRRMHCEYMSYALIHYLWIHEITHITNGHLTNLRQHTGQPESIFHEFYLGQFADSPSKDNLDCLAMELDADIEAATVMIGLIMSDIDIESDDAPFVSCYERVTIFVFALVAFYASVAAKERSSQSLGSHPPAMLRLENILIHIVGMVRQKGDLQQAIVNGYTLFRSISDQITHNWLPPTTIGSDQSKTIANSKWWKVHQHRKAISTGYDEYRFGTLRIFMSSIYEELQSSTLFELGPEPSWWKD